TRFWMVFLLMVSIYMETNWIKHSAAEAGLETAGSAKLDIMLVLDNSGSMKKNDPDFLTRNVVENFIDRLKADTRMGMLIFDRDARLIKPLTPVDQPQLQNQFLESLKQVNYQGRWTNSPAAMERAIYELKSNGRHDAGKMIIFLTDGIVDTGDKEQDRAKEQWLKDILTLDAKKSGVRIFAIAFTENADFSLIQTLAVKTNGEYYRAYQADEIASVFQSIQGMLAQPAGEPAKAETPAPEERKSGTQPSTAPQKTPEKQTGLPLPMILAAAVLVAGVIILILVVRGRKTASAHEPADQPQVRIPKAQLLDIQQTVFDKPRIIAKPHMRIGRDGNNDIVIPEETISSLHATISFSEGQFYLEDQRSSNQTFLQGKALEPNKPVPLKSGDEIKFDIYAFQFMRPDQAPAGATKLAATGASGQNATTLRPDGPPAQPQQSASASEVETKVKQAMCPHHPSRKATELCTVCKQAFCKQCVTQKDAKEICSACADRN
ncbi:MAG: FHA domain-containing protein, partial [Desulfobacteraceae bacterium]